MKHPNCIKKIFKRAGEEFTLNSLKYIGVFRLLDSGTIHNYLDDVEAMAVVKPALLLVTSSDVPIAINNTITRDGRTYKVMKTCNQHIGGVLAAKWVILS